MRKIFTTIATGVTTLGALGVMAPAAHARADAYPCGPQWWHSGQRVYVQTCPDWSPNNSIPVHDYNDHTSRVVGYIYAPGDDWYVCGWTGTRQTAHGATNHWWALTVADNGKAGWVNQIYFRGGSDSEPDGGLKICPFRSLTGTAAADRLSGSDALKAVTANER